MSCAKLDCRAIRTIARKELRSYFLSPVALIFLGVFLTVTLFLFFTYSKFFARNLADVRPLFSWLPLLLVFLVSALTMRQWSEEQKMGTLEILMTLPVRTVELTLGKFLAGMALVAMALALTLPLPLTAWFLGPLDWGPVIGGYVAALLLSGMYMAIGLCVSARTDNQIVALMVSSLIGLGFYLLGSETLTGLFGHGGAEVLRALGTGSRFESIERGVLDIRDLLYYGSLTVFFLLLNVSFLEINRIEREPDDRPSGLKNLWLTVLLAGANVVAANLWMAPVTSFRSDLTEDGEYSISPATARILASLREPLTITGYFSSKTHPLLAPLVPRITNLLEEYEVIGRGKVRVVIEDPNRDVEVEKEINEHYGIKSVPFRVASRHEKSVVNSYFHLLIRYGDQYEVLGFDDLIEVYADETEIQVRLKNLEYDMTRAIKKTAQGFQGIEGLIARADQAVSLTAYISTASLPEEFKEAPARIEKIATELAEKSAGRFRFQKFDPSEDQKLQEKIFRSYGFRPLAADLFGEQRFYLHMVVETGSVAERIFPQGDLSEASIRTSIEAAVKRAIPGSLKTVALLTETPQTPQWGMPPGMGDRENYQTLAKVFESEYSFKKVKLDDGVVPSDVDVLIVAKAGTLSDKQKFGIDQFLMRGGAVIALTGAYDVSPDVKATEVDQGLLDLLKGYGVEVEKALVMDPVNSRFPVPVRVPYGPLMLEKIEMIPYPFFPDIRRDGYKAGHVALTGIPSVSVTWSSPLKLSDKLEDRKGDVLLRSSKGSWLHKSTDLQPDFKRFPDTGFLAESGEKVEARPVAVSVVGTFPSAFADKPSPLFTGKKDEKKEDDGHGHEDEEDEAEKSEGPQPQTTGTATDGKKEDRTGRTLLKSTPDARLVVVGSSSFASDIIANLDFRSGTDSFGGNLVLVRNLVDWSLEDTDLLEIRSAGSFARTLRPMPESEKTTYEVLNYVAVLLALGAVAMVAATRRRMASPLVRGGTL